MAGSSYIQWNDDDVDFELEQCACFIVLAHWYNSLWEHMSIHSGTLSRFRAKILLYSYSSKLYAQQRSTTYQFYSLWFDRTSRLIALDASTPIITPSVRLRRVWRYQSGNQIPYIEEEQTTQWLKERVQKDKQRSIKHTYKTKDQLTRTPLKAGGELRCLGRLSSSCSLDWRLKMNKR